MCPVVVGQACSNMLAISPAVIDPPWKCSVTRIRRRTGWASAVNTASYASSLAFGSCPAMTFAMPNIFSAQANHWQVIFSVLTKHMHLDVHAHSELRCILGTQIGQDLGQPPPRSGLEYVCVM